MYWMLCKFSVLHMGFIKACKLKIVFGIGVGGGEICTIKYVDRRKGVYNLLPIVCVFSAAQCFSKQRDVLHKISPNWIVFK